MYTGSTPDALMNVRPVDLNDRQRTNLASVWPAAHAAIAHLNMLMEDGSLDLVAHLDGAPLWRIVRWYTTSEDDLQFDS